MTVDATDFEPAVEINGFSGSAQHRNGFAFASSSSPVGAGGALSEPLIYDDNIAKPNTLAGVDLVRQLSYMNEWDSNNMRIWSRWSIEHDLISYGIEHVTFGLWSYVGQYVPGYFQGRPTYWGSYIYGSETVASELSQIPSSEYTGLSGAHWLFPESYAVRSHYGPASISYDATTKSVTITVQLEQYAPVVYTIEFVDGAPEPISSSEAVLVDPVQCVAALNQADGTFACELPASAGVVSGRFYGPKGAEVAGVFRRVAPSGPGSNEGIIGGFIAKATQ